MFVIYFFLGQILWRMKDHVHKIQQARLKHTSTAIPKKGTIHQPLNHFDKQNDKTFPQVQIIDKTSHSSCKNKNKKWETLYNKYTVA